MAFSKEWEDIYKKGEQFAAWPWPGIISRAYRVLKLNGTEKVLELGCGSGANISFFKDIVSYYGIDGSKTIVDYVSKKFPELKDNIMVGDFTKELCFPANYFDLIFDHYSITFNDTKSIINTLALIKNKLRKGGFFIGSMWCSDKHSEIANGLPYDGDTFTRHGYKDGMFAGAGDIHFCSYEHLVELFTKFNILEIEHRIDQQCLGSKRSQEAYWNLVVTKE